MKNWKLLAAAMLSSAILIPALANAADMSVYPRQARHTGAYHW